MMDAFQDWTMVSAWLPRWAGSHGSASGATQTVTTTRSSASERICSNRCYLVLSASLLSRAPQMADMLVTGGYRDVGYDTVIIDDCWLDHQRYTLILSILARRIICFVHCQLILIIQISGGQTSTRPQKVSEWNPRSSRLYSQTRIEVWHLWGKSRFWAFFLLVCCQGSIYSNRITVIWHAAAIRGYWDTWRMMPTLSQNGVDNYNTVG